MYLELAIDVAGVGLDRVQRKNKPGRDLSIAQPLGNELEHFKLTLAQRLDRIPRRACPEPTEGTNSLP
jgi:hypothetical protein